MKSHVRIVFTALVVPVLIGFVATASANDFKPGCVIPFQAIEEEHPIDRDCAIEGAGSGDAHHAQNKAKNNFCATGQPVEVTVSSFLDLQQAAEDHGIPFGSSKSLPPDRSVLKNLLQRRGGTTLGEGTKVQLVAFIVDAKNSNVSKGESVNCKKGGKERNDIHISLAKKPTDALCKTVTAEMSPHLRPAAWDRENLDTLAHRPVRITGQLFFDASHKPCTAGKKASPARASNWEIHPVYKIEVFDVPSSRFISLEDWAAMQH